MVYEDDDKRQEPVLRAIAEIMVIVVLSCAGLRVAAPLRVAVFVVPI